MYWMMSHTVPSTSIGCERARDVGGTVEPALQPLELHAVLGAEFPAELDVVLNHRRFADHRQCR